MANEYQRFNGLQEQVRPQPTGVLQVPSRVDTRPAGTSSNTNRPERHSDSRDLYYNRGVEPLLSPQDDFSPEAIHLREQQAAEEPRFWTAQDALTGDAPDPNDPNARTAAVLTANRNAAFLNRYPALLGAAVQAGLTEQEAQAVVNWTIADQAAQRLMATQDYDRQRAILMSMSQPQRLATMSVVGMRVDEMLAPKDWLENSWNWMWEHAVDPVLTGLENLNEGAQHTLRAMNVWEPTGLGSESASTWSWTEAWDRTEKGQYDPEYIAQLKQEHGELPVQVLLDAQEIQSSDVEDPIGVLWDRYADNVEARRIIDQLLLGEGDENLQHLASLVDSAHLGDLGNIVANNVLGEETRGNLAWTTLDKTANAVGVFGFDPTIVGAKARAAYVASRYAVSKMGQTGGLVAAFNKPAVARFWDTLGADLRRAGKDGLKRDVVRRQYGRWLSDDTIEELRKAEVFSASQALHWLQGQDAVRLLSKGQPARRREILMPHMTRAGKARRAVSRKAADLNPVNRAGREDWEQFGGASPELVASRLTEDAEQIGRTVGVTDNKKMVGYRRADSFLIGEKAWARRTDRFLRTFSRAYDNIGGIRIDSAADAQRVYRYARTFLTRYHAVQVADAFRLGSVSDRFKIVQGLNRTAGYALGVDLKNGVQAVDDLAAVTRRTARYSPVVAGLRTDFSVASVVNREAPQYASTPTIRTGSVAIDARVRQHGREMADLISRRKALNEEIKAVRNELRRARKDSKKFDEMDELTTEAGVSTADLQAQLRLLTDDMKDVRRALSEKDRLMADYLKAEAKDATATSKSIGRRIKKLQKHVDEGVDDATTRYVDEADRLATVQGSTRAEAGYLTNQINRIKEQREALQKVDPEDLVEIDPSNFNGEQLAIYPWQTSNVVAIPDIKTLYELKARTGAIDAVLGWSQSTFAQRLTDTWSLLTLAGPRYALRNAVEDWLMYTLTNGSLTDLYRGRRISTALRGSTRTHGATLAKSRQGKPYAAQGFFNRNMRRSVENYTPRALADLLMPHMDPAEIKAAVSLARKYGEYDAMADLATRAWIRSKGTFSGPDVDRYLDEMIRNGHAGPVVDELIELSRHMLDGTLPGSDLGMTEGLGAVRMRGNGTFREFRADDPKYLAHWYHRIDNIVERTGKVGKIAIANLEKPEVAIAKMAQAIDDAPEVWANRMAAMQNGADANEMARRVYTDILTHFSGPNGNINRGLLGKVRHTVIKDGERKTVVSMRNPETGFRLRTEDLKQYKAYERPTGVIGEEQVEIPLLSDISLSDRIWQVLGEQHNRIAREPVYYANYIQQRRQFQWYERMLVEEKGLSKKAAAKAADHLAVDRAYELTMSFTDNPKNRTLGAWNARNFARYYRATEDFYRRMLRLTQENPEALWKVALTYDTIDHSGFIYTGDDGEKYFVYPGSKAVMQAVGGVLSVLGDRKVMIPDVPTMFTGRVDMLTPSLNVDQMLPTFAGPLGAIPAKALFDFVPAFKGLERAVLGEYSEGQNVVTVAFPAAVTRFLRAMDKDERDSQYASAFRNAAQIATAAGMVPEVGASDDDIQQFKDRLGSIATAIVYTRFITAWSLPAAATVQQDNTSQWAKLMGAVTMRQAFTQIVNSKGGNFSEALAEWYETNPDNFPYTVSQGEVGEGFKPAARASFNPQWEKWMRDNAPLREKFPSAATFLAPAAGDDEWEGAYNFARSIGLRVNKSTESFLNDVLTAKGRQVYYSTQDDYEDARAAASTTEERKAIDEKWSKLREQIFADYPGVKTRVQTQSKKGQYAEETNDEVGRMLGYIYGSDAGFPGRGEAHSELESPATKSIGNAYLTYQDGRAAILSISGTTQGATDQRKEMKARLTSILQEIASSDPNADWYYNNVLRYLVDDIPTGGRS